jgi:preprotein translocase subunit SecD
VLDGLVISAPTMNGVIPNGQAQISGNFTQATAETLANQLKFGALPLSFTEESIESVSATLGTEQLRIGLVAGVVGLLLVVAYSLLQYRALGLVTVASLVAVGIITYGLLLLLSWRQGYRLSLPGVAGLIVAIGITADSFIIYFERIRDEIRDGRSLEVAVERGWERARRTILASDAVSFLAAVVLYLLAVGGVRGFAFTLGLTTVIDLIIVFLFTKPLVTLLARTHFFASGHKLSGFDPEHLGSVVARRAVRGGAVAAGATSGSTLAERKRAAARASEGAVL